MRTRMKRHKGKLAGIIGVLAIAILGAGGWVLLGSDDGNEIQAIRQGSQIQFRIANNAVETMRTEIFNLGGKRLYDSGPTTGNSLNWPMTTEAGERVARGVYLYVIQAWGPDGELVKSRTGKVAVTPDGVGLGQAPSTDGSENDTDTPDKSNESTGDSVESAAVDQDHSGESWAFGTIGIGTTDPTGPSGTVANIFASSGVPSFSFERENGAFGYLGSGTNASVFAFDDQHSFKIGRVDSLTDVTVTDDLVVDSNGRVGIGTDNPTGPSDKVVNISASTGVPSYAFERAGEAFGYLGSGTSASVFAFDDQHSFKIGRVNSLTDVTVTDDLLVDANGNVGIGTDSPSAALEVNRSTSNLLVLRNASTGGSSVFRAENDGDVFADGSYNCGLSSGCFNSGQGADVAERMVTNEKLEVGDVVEIAPNRAQQFRKTQNAFSRRVAGVVSGNPGVTLGNDFNSRQENWQDNRPLLALAGRVPVKATAEYGEIETGDLLVSAPMPGYAMACPRDRECAGQVIGKALQSLTAGTGTIKIQVTLQ